MDSGGSLFAVLDFESNLLSLSEHAESFALDLSLVGKDCMDGSDGGGGGGKLGEREGENGGT